MAVCLSDGHIINGETKTIKEILVLYLCPIKYDFNLMEGIDNILLAQNAYFPPFRALRSLSISVVKLCNVVFLGISYLTLDILSILWHIFVGSKY